MEIRLKLKLKMFNVCGGCRGPSSDLHAEYKSIPGAYFHLLTYLMYEASTPQEVGFVNTQ